MQLTHAKESDNRRAGNAIRGGAREFKTLLTGEEGSPGNYKLSFVHQTGELNIPRHKHNFDQIRMCLEGDKQNYGKNKWIEPGELVYFPEGTPYGPEQSSSHRLSITLQFGGASGSGYIGMKRIHQAIDEMKAFGTFEGGVFTRTGDLAPGQRRNQDSYEAIWEHVNKRKLTYPKPRYEEPVRIKPRNFDWLKLAGQPGVAREIARRLLRAALGRLDAAARCRRDGANRALQRHQDLLRRPRRGRGERRGALQAHRLHHRCRRGLQARQQRRDGGSRRGAARVRGGGGAGGIAADGFATLSVSFDMLATRASSG